jgi:hypothetical protein
MRRAPLSFGGLLSIPGRGLCAKRFDTKPSPSLPQHSRATPDRGLMLQPLTKNPAFTTNVALREKRPKKGIYVSEFYASDILAYFKCCNGHVSPELYVYRGCSPQCNLPGGPFALRPYAAFGHLSRDSLTFHRSTLGAT